MTSDRSPHPNRKSGYHVCQPVSYNSLHGHSLELTNAHHSPAARACMCGEPSQLQLRQVRRFLNKKPTAPVSVKLAIRQYPLCSFHLVGQSRRLSFSGTLWNTEVSLTASMAASPPSIFSKMHVTAHPGFSTLRAESPTVCVISDTHNI